MPVDRLVDPKIEDAFDLDLQVVEVTTPTNTGQSQAQTNCSWACTECWCTVIC